MRNRIIYMFSSNEHVRVSPVTESNTRIVRLDVDKSEHDCRIWQPTTKEIDSSRKRLCHQTYFFTVKHFVSLLSFCAPFWECLYGTEGHCDATSHCCALFYCSFISRDVLFLAIPLQSLMTLLIPSNMFDRKVIKKCDQMERFKLNGSNETIRLTRNQG